MNLADERFEHIELFGKPALLTDYRVSRAAVSDGWYCYDVRGGDDDPGRPATLENHVGVNYVGTVLAREPILFRNYLPIEETLNYIGEELSLREFCEVHGFDGG